MTRLAQLSPLRPFAQGFGSQQMPVPEHDERSLRDLLKAGALGSVAIAGNVLSLGGAMVRRGLMGENPLLPLTSPFAGEHHRTGRDLLRHYGLIGRKDTWSNFLPGLATDIATDPLSWMLPAKSALTPAGTAASKSGLLKDLTRGAVTKAGKAMGPAQSRLTRTPMDILKALPIEEQATREAAYRTAAKAAGMTDDAVAASMNQVVGRQGAFALPFSRQPIATFGGSGPLAQGWARTKDVIGQTIRDSMPVRGIRQALASSTRGSFSPEVQKNAPRLFSAEDTATVATRRQTSDLMQPAIDTGLVGNEHNRVLRGLYEAPDDVADEVLRMVAAETGQSPDALRRIRDARNTIQSKEVIPNASRAPVIFNELQDDTVNYMTRHTALGRAGKGAKEYSAEVLEQKSRGDALRNFQGHRDDLYSQTNTLNRLVDETKTMKGKDLRAHLQQSHVGQPGIATYYDQAQQAQLAKFDEIAQSQRASAQQAADAAMRNANPGQQAASQADLLNQQRQIASNHAALRASVKPHDRVEELADFIEGLPQDIRDAGLFPNSPIVDYHQMLDGLNTAMARSSWVTDTITRPGVLKDAADPALQGKSVGLQKLATELKMDYKEVLSRVSRELNMTPADAARLRVPEDIASDLLKATEKFIEPYSVGKLTEWWDDAANLIKAGQTSLWPAFHTRNLTGSAIQQMLDGTFGPTQRAALAALQRGKPHKYWRTFPGVVQEAKRKGIDLAKASDKQVTDMAADLIWRYDVSPQSAGEHLAQVGAGTGAPVAHEAKELLGERIGFNPASWREVARRAAGLGDNATLNPLKGEIRGFRGANRSTLGPFAAGDMAGAMIEQKNRVPSWLKLVDEGYDPQVATEMVRLSQVDYAGRAYSPLVREKLLRLIPYGKFQIGMLKKVGHELSNYPGGPHAIAIKAAGGMQDRESMVPPWVSQQMAVGLGETPEGDKRFWTGAGLMHEPAVNYVQPSAQGLGLHMLSQMSPMLKAPLELATGQTMFQQGPLGGRAMEDLDPTVGRTLSNMMVTAGMREQEGAQPVRWAGPATKLLEHAIANSPLGRAGTTARTVFDPRKSALEKAANTLTGLRTTTVSAQAQDAMIRDLVAAEARRHPAGRLMVMPYFSEHAKGQLTQAETEEMERLEEIRNLLVRRAKARAQQRR